MRTLALLALMTQGCTTRADVTGTDKATTPDTGKSGQDTDSGDSSDSGDSGNALCNKLSIDALGPKAPVVGDQWVIWVNCDDARLLGPMVIAFDPTDFVSMDQNTATFLYAGSAVLSVTAAGSTMTDDVTVTDP